MGLTDDGPTSSLTRPELRLSDRATRVLETATSGQFLGPERYRLQLAAEYHVPVYRMSIYTVQQGAPLRLPKLSLSGDWICSRIPDLTNFLRVRVTVGYPEPGAFP
jgi:hypothetical protein